MKYMLLIHQGDTPTPRDPEAWARLSEDEQQQVYARLPGDQPDAGRQPRRCSSQPPSRRRRCAWRTARR